jgi:hypothetical protein
VKPCFNHILKRESNKKAAFDWAAFFELDIRILNLDIGTQSRQGVSLPLCIVSHANFTMALLHHVIELIKANLSAL